MDVFGYNLTNNKTNFIKNTLTTRTIISGIDFSNLFFGYSSRSNIDWGNAVTILSNLSNIYFVTKQDITTDIFYLTFFGEDDIFFKVVRAGESAGSVGDWRFNSDWIIIEKFSTTDVSFEELLSNQNSSGIITELKLFDATFTEIAGSDSIIIDTIKNVNPSLYSSPIDSKLVTIGNSDISGSNFDNLRYITNISDGSYSKCYNLSLTTINDIISGNINLSNITCDLVNEYGITIITGLKYKSLVKTSLIDYALIFEYATQTGSKNLTITTENFEVIVSSLDQLGIFMDTNPELTNTNTGNISAVDSNLIDNNLFRQSLTIDYTDVPTSLLSDSESFFKYLLSKNFINHNRIRSAKVSWITDRYSTGLSGFTSTIIGDKTYYIRECDIGSNTIAESYNIQNILVDISLEIDFNTIGLNPPSKYDMYKDADSTVGYVVYNGNEWLEFNPDFKLREIALYYKNNSDEFIPVYYARTDFIINNTGTYTFQIII